jgi:hypothetical protein
MVRKGVVHGESGDLKIAVRPKKVKTYANDEIETLLTWANLSPGCPRAWKKASESCAHHEVAAPGGPHGAVCSFSSTGAIPGLTSTLSPEVSGKE